MGSSRAPRGPLRPPLRSAPAPRLRTPQRAEPPGTAAESVLELQRTAGNAAVVQLFQDVAGAGDGGAPTAYGALDDPTFNADNIAHDLLRAINQEEYSFALKQTTFGGYEEDVSKEKRNVDYPKVVASLENLTASQVAEVKRRYHDFEKRTTLDEDLFGGGQSNRPSSLTPDQRARITALLQGTKAEPISAHDLAELATFPPAAAARMRAALLDKQSADASPHRFEADAVELHELLSDLDAAKRERVMVLQRRPVKEIAAVDAAYDHLYGQGNLERDLDAHLEGLQRVRVAELRRGNWVQADAVAIEDKRRAIEKITALENSTEGNVLSAFSVVSDIGGNAMRDLKQQKEALSSDIAAIMETNRREALADPENAGKSSSEAVAERFGKILGQQDGEAGHTLGSELTRTLGAEHATAITAAADTWNTAGGASLVRSAAAELAATEKAGTTTAGKIMATLRSFRELARHDLLARVHDPAVSLDEKQKIGENIESAVTRLAQQYIDDYAAAYNSMRGDGRTYDEIVASADKADQILISDLSFGGGRTSDLGELDHAMRKEDVDAIKEILRRQPNREAINELVASYNKLGEGHDLRRELFGTSSDNATYQELLAEYAEKRRFTGGMVVGRDAVQIAEYLTRPTAAELSGEPPADASGKAVAPGTAEAQWIASSGAREYDITMAHRGLTGRLREIGDDPETERLLVASRDKLKELHAQWAAETNPAAKQHLLLEMRKTRAALTGDADAYEKDNERVLNQIREALTFAVSIALAIAIPGAGAGLAAFLETTAINIAANVAANVVIKGDDYTWADLKGDVLGGVLGAAGGKFGEEVLGRVAARIAAPAGRAAIDVTEKVGITTALAKEGAAIAKSSEKTVIAVEEFEGKEAGREAASAATREGETVVGEGAGRTGAGPGEVGGKAGAGGGKAGAAAAAPEKTVWEKGAREIGGFFGGIFGGKLPSGDLSLTWEEFGQALITTGAAKAAHREPTGKGGHDEHAKTDEHAKNAEHKTDEHTTTDDEQRRAEEEAKRQAEEQHIGVPAVGLGGEPRAPMRPGQELLYDAYKSDAHCDALIDHFGSWEAAFDAIHYGEGIAAGIPVPTRDMVLRTLQERRGRLLAQLDRLFGARGVATASEERGSDVDLNVEGPNAGETIIKAERYMNEHHPGWQRRFRMDFMVTAGRARSLGEAMRTLGHDATQRMQRRQTEASEAFLLARQAQHAEPARRNEMLAQISDPALRAQAELVASMSDPRVQRDRYYEALLETDRLTREALATPGEHELSAAIESQMFANALNPEAYVSPGAIETIVLKRGGDAPARYQTVLDQISMLQHQAEAHGGMEGALRRYETYKYIDRIVDELMPTIGKDNAAAAAKLKFLKLQAQLAYKMVRRAQHSAEPMVVEARDATNKRTDMVKYNDWGEVPGVSSEYLGDMYGMLNDVLAEQLPALRAAAMDAPGAGGAPGHGGGGPPAGSAGAVATLPVLEMPKGPHSTRESAMVKLAGEQRAMTIARADALTAELAELRERVAPKDLDAIDAATKTAQQLRDEATGGPGPDAAPASIADHAKSVADKQAKLERLIGLLKQRATRDAAREVAKLGKVLEELDNKIATGTHSRTPTPAEIAWLEVEPRRKALAYDPGGDGQYRVAEAQDMLAAEAEGIVAGEVTRSPRDGEDFLDGQGRGWSHKGSRGSATPEHVADLVYTAAVTGRINCLCDLTGFATLSDAHEAYRLIRSMVAASTSTAEIRFRPASFAAIPRR